MLIFIPHFIVRRKSLCSYSVTLLVTTDSFQNIFCYPSIYRSHYESKGKSQSHMVVCSPQGVRIQPFDSSTVSLYNQKLQMHLVCLYCHFNLTIIAHHPTPEPSMGVNSSTRNYLLKSLQTGIRCKDLCSILPLLFFNQARTNQIRVQTCFTVMLVIRDFVLVNLCLLSRTICRYEKTSLIHLQ